MKKVNVNGLNEQQYCDLYLDLCNEYNKINQNNVDLDFNGLYRGFLICENPI